MPLKKKKFIDKKKATTFRLVHRSQKDPLVADEKAPQHVLLECDKSNQNENDKRKEEQQKFGIYYDDDYNYLQHLRDVKTITEWSVVSVGQCGTSSETGETAKAQKDDFPFNLPSSVFQSFVEENEGLLHKAAPDRGPKIDWDPDIVAALDDNFDFGSENELEDDFVTLANQEDSQKSKSIFSGYTEEEEEEESEEDDDDDSDLSFESGEYKHNFTNYSMSSSVLPRSKNLQDVDDHFEKFLEQYDDDGIGALDCDDIQGYVKPDSELVQQLAEKYAEEQDKSTMKEIILTKQKVNVQEKDDSSLSDEDFIEVTVHEKPTDNWDCESILSTYSTTSHRPRIIDETKKNPRIEVSNTSGLPRYTLRTKGLTTASLKTLDNSLNGSSRKDNIYRKSTVSSIARRKDETASEKKDRKAAIKQLRRERRAEKKVNQLAFKEEEQRQEKVVLNLKQNLNGIKLL